MPEVRYTVAGSRRALHEGRIRCSRCDVVCLPEDVFEWRVEPEDGYLKRFTCPACQTPEEALEAQVEAAVSVYGVDEYGRATYTTRVASEPSC